jgi:hypothetical protein
MQSIINRRMREMLQLHASLSPQLTAIREVLPEKRKQPDPTAFDHVVPKSSVTGLIGDSLRISR